MNRSRGLYRSRTQSMIGGVAGGIGEYLNTDATLIRILFVLLAIFGGGGVLLYVILWIALPMNPDFFYNPHDGTYGPFSGGSGHSARGEGQSSDGTGFSSTSDQENKSSEGSLTEDDDNPGPSTTTSLVVGLVLISLGGVLLVDAFFPQIDFIDMWPLLLVVAGFALIRSSYFKPNN